MRINRNNYEIFFIDFYDNKLTPAQKLEVELFLESNPDLKAEFEEFENVTIIETAAKYEPKLDLKKPEIKKGDNNAIRYNKIWFKDCAGSWIYNNNRR